jgi:eukaryotic-like serine/threonine-protein kinase
MQMTRTLGRYEIISELGHGAMGVVYKAYDPLIERFVAVKAINLQVLSENGKSEYEQRFYQEAKAAGQLNHPSIVTIYDVGESVDDVAYIAMELMEGRELQEILDGARRLSLEEALNIAIQVASGLAYAHHHGIVHRDIKPSNIMVMGNNLIKIADFGIARIPSSMLSTKTGMIMGSPLYMSPEQIMGQAVDARSDIFSLGIVLYQMLTWRLPFSGDNPHSVMYQIVNTDPPEPSSLNPEVSEALNRLVAKCLAKNPDDRYANANELAADLRSCREALLRALAGFDHPFVISSHVNRLKRLTIPGAYSENFVAFRSYLAIVAIYIVDVVTPRSIQLHLLYIFPLIMVSFHCARIRLVQAAVILALLLQGLHIATDNTLPEYSKIALAIMVFLANIMVVYVSRIARINYFEVAQLSSFDRLTGLRNRLSFETIADLEVDKQKRKGGVFSFARVDINNFKELNESKGYAAGDKILKLIANVIRENIRQFDTPARIGGDEFAILMPNTDAAGCESFCRHLSAEISKSMKDMSLPFSTSIGYATFEHVPASISEVFDKAKIAMHEAQASGKEFAVSG